MTIFMQQKCDGCETTRELNVKDCRGVLANVTHKHGWRNVPGSEYEHLCPRCVEKIVPALKHHLVGSGTLAKA